MTKIFRIAALALLASAATPGPSAVAGEPQAARAAAPTVGLAGAQDRILAAKAKAYASGDFSGFDAVAAEIAAVRAGAPQAAYYKSYWSAFLDYQRAIALMRRNRKEDARGSLDRAIATLKAMPSRDGEVNALLGMSSGLQLAFIPRQHIVVAAQESGSYLAAGLASGKPTPRIYFASAIADWNTPAIFGGTKKAEGYAKQAIALREAPSQIRPTWGRDEAMALLIRIYASRKQTADAAALLAQARREYPGSLAVSEVAGQI